MNRFRPFIRRAALTMVGLATAWSLGAAAQGDPSKTVRMVVSFAPGGVGDFLARTLQQRLQQKYGQAFVVENKAGASGTVGAAEVARAAPDGHTLLVTNQLIVQAPNLYTKLPYDPLTDFIPITEVIRTPLWLAVNASKVPARNLAAYVALAKANPADYPYASTGAGSSHHLYGHHFNTVNGLSLTHVPYKGGAPAVLALVSGEVASVFLDYVSLKPHVESSKLRLLASTGTKRSPLTPDVPTLAESGFAGFESYGWGALFAPAKTPMGVVAQLHEEINKALRHPDVVAKFQGFGFEIGGTPQAQFATQYRADHDHWTSLIRKADVKLE